MRKNFRFVKGFAYIGTSINGENQLLKIRLLTVGKIENEHTDALAEMYRKRIEHYVAFDWEIVKPEKIKTLTPTEILAREARRIELKMDSRDKTILLDKDGNQYSSEELAAFLENASSSGKRMTFVIGGPWGVADTVRKNTALSLSLSKMTFPHELATVMLLEQLYRALSLQKGEKYHK